MTHLTTIPDTTTVLAYHTSDDVQAVRTADGSERLYVNGVHVPLTLQLHHHAVQQVINYCHMSKLEQASRRKQWLALAGEAPEASRMITVTYRSVDGFRKARKFRTLDGARRFAHNYVGEHPELGSFYAVSFDGVGRVTVTGATLQELFPIA